MMLNNTDSPARSKCSRRWDARARKAARLVTVVMMASALAMLVFPGSFVAQAQVGSASSPISYQGRLADGGMPANGSYDFEFRLVDAATGGEAVGQAISATLTVQQGVFTTALSFPASAFDGTPRWIEVRVRKTPAAGAAASELYVLERQPLLPTPYAIRAATAGTVASVPIQSLPSAVPLKNGDGKLDSALLGSDIARASDVTALVQAMAEANQQLAELRVSLVALTHENAQLRSSLTSAAAPLRSGWMAASTDPADASLINSGFSKAFSAPEPKWTFASATDAPTGRSDASAVWTGHEWLVWGGRGPSQVPFGTGSGYRPASDTWVEISQSDAPEARGGHSAVWTGSEMIVWGGFAKTSLNTGGRYSRDRLSWEPVASVGAPSARQGHGAAWTGKYMVVFGGQNASGLLNDGGLYDPTLNQWTALPAGQAPTARSGATVLWTGSGVLVWGGDAAEGGDAAGAVLRFDADGNPTAWDSLPALPGFAGRSGHVASWDGQRLIVWGGRSASQQLLADGAVLDLASGTWTAMTVLGAPSPRYKAHGAWTGEELIVFGGQSSAGPLGAGHAWNRATGTWRVLPSSTPAVPRWGGVAAWTGTEFLLFGGQGVSGAGPLAQPQRIAASMPWHFFRRSGN